MVDSRVHDRQVRLQIVLEDTWKGCLSLSSCPLNQLLLPISCLAGLPLQTAEQIHSCQLDDTQNRSSFGLEFLGRLAGPFQMDISNQRLHCALTRKRLQVFQAFTNQLAAFYAPAPRPVGGMRHDDTRAAPLVEASAWAGDDSCDAHPADLLAHSPVHVMDGVVQDAFMG